LLNALARALADEDMGTVSLGLDAVRLVIPDLVKQREGNEAMVQNFTYKSHLVLPTITSALYTLLDSTSETI
jgi:hypothetical protein